MLKGSGDFLFLLRGVSIFVVAPDLPGAVENGQCIVGIMVHPHPRLDEVMADRAGRDLQFFAPVMHRIIRAHLALFLNAQHIGHIEPGDRHA